MGLTIHYNGRLRTKAVLPALIEEVKDIVEIYKWGYRIYETQFPINRFGRKKVNNSLYGISFYPPECEQVDLAFLSSGELISWWGYTFYIKSLIEKKPTLHVGNSVKTQYAGASIHKLLIHLFDHLSKKYFRQFKMIDEGQYWETRDEKLLNENFAFLSSLIEGFQSVLDGNRIHKGEAFDEYFKRLLTKIHGCANFIKIGLEKEKKQKKYKSKTK